MFYFFDILKKTSNGRRLYHFDFISPWIIIDRKPISACNENKQPAVMLPADKTFVKNGWYFSYPHLCNQELWHFFSTLLFKDKKLTR